MIVIPSIVSITIYLLCSVLCYLLVVLPVVGILDNTSLTLVKQRFKECNIIIVTFRIILIALLILIITFFITGMFLMITIVDVISFVFISKLVINQFYERKMSKLTRIYAIVFYGKEEL